MNVQAFRELANEFPSLEEREACRTGFLAGYEAARDWEAGQPKETLQQPSTAIFLTAIQACRILKIGNPSLVECAQKVREFTDSSPDRLVSLATVLEMAPMARHEPNPTPATVWMLEEVIRYEGSTLLGVFSSKDKAESYARENHLDLTFERGFTDIWLSIYPRTIDQE